MRNSIDIDGFKEIGLVKFYYNYSSDDDNWKDAYFEIYVPEKLNYKRGNMYCLRFVYLNDELAHNSVTIEKHELTVEQIDDCTCISGIKFIMSDKQLEKVKEIASIKVVKDA